MAALLCQALPVMAQHQEAAELAAEGWTAIEKQRYGAAQRAFTAASEIVPNDPTLWLGRGFAAYMLGRDDDAGTLLEHALSLQPRLVDGWRLLGELHYRNGRVEDAIESYEEALAYAPDDAALVDRIEAWEREEDLHDEFNESRGAHFRVLFEGPSDDGLAQRVVQMLEGAYLNVGSRLGTYPAHAITVVLYTQEQFRDVTRSPEWAAASYDGQIRIPVRGARGQEGALEGILTHEYVHAVVASLAGRAVPAWLNEGLATVLEPGESGWASEVLADTPSRPALDSLHDNFAGLPADQVHVAYALSAAAVDRMMSVGGVSGVVLLLEDMAKGIRFDRAFHRRIGVRYNDFVRQAQRLR